MKQATTLTAAIFNAFEAMDIKTTASMVKQIEFNILEFLNRQAYDALKNKTTMDKLSKEIVEMLTGAL